MNVAELRNKIIQIVQGADEKYLKQLEAFMHLQTDDLSVSDEHKKILDDRLAQHKANPKAGRSWREIKAELSSKYGV